MGERISTEQIIEQLAAGLSPVKSATPLFVFARLCAALVSIVVALSYFHGFREDALDVLSDKMFLIENGIYLFCFVLAVAMAVRSAFPSEVKRIVPPWIPYLLLCAVLGMFVMFSAPVFSADFVDAAAWGVGCLLTLLAYACLPLLVLWWEIRRGFSVRPRTSGGYALLAAASAGALGLSFACDYNAPEHLLVWHAMPVFVLSVLGFVTGWFFFRPSLNSP